MLEADLLVLDDLGAEKTSEWVQETLGLVINTRYNARRATIFTSNLVDPIDNDDPNSFMFQLGARTRSRLLEMCDWVEIQGADVRDASVMPRRKSGRVAEERRRTQAEKEVVCLPPKPGHGRAPSCAIPAFNTS